MVNLDLREQNTIILTEDQGKELIKALNIEMVEEGGSGLLFPCSLCSKVGHS